MNLPNKFSRLFLVTLLSLFSTVLTLAADESVKIVGPTIEPEEIASEAPVIVDPESPAPLRSTYTSFKSRSFGKTIEQTDTFEMPAKSGASKSTGALGFEEYAREHGFKAELAPGAAGAKPKKPEILYHTVTKKASYHEFQPEKLDSSWDISTGYRRDNFRWSIAGDVTGQNPDILSELTWDHLDIIQLAAQNKIVMNDRYVLNGALSYGWILDGTSRDSDYSGDNRTVEFSKSTSDSDGDNTFDASLGFGYKLKPHPRLSITPMVGYSYNEINLRDGNGRQDIDTISGDLGPFQGLDTTYESVWQGPWAGADISYRLGRGWTFFTNWEYHWGDYKAVDDHNLREDFAHPVSFEHEADMEGVTGTIGFDYALSKHWSINLKSDMFWRWTEQGVDTTYFSSGRSAQTQFNGTEWNSIALMIGATYHFDPIYTTLSEEVEEPVDLKNFSPIRVWGRYRLAMGVDMEESEAIYNDANSVLNIHTLQGPQSDYLFGERQNNTYDPAIYSQYLLNIELNPKDHWTVYSQLVADPWSWVGTTGEEVTKNNQNAAIEQRYNLKYFGALNSTIREVYRNPSTDRVTFPYIKAHHGHLTNTTVQGFDDYDGVPGNGRGLTFNIPEQDLDFEFRPVRKAWVDYAQDDWHARFFALADQEQALTTDDPLQLSNHKDYWQQSPWLYQYKPLMFFNDQSVRRGFYSDALSYYARDSEGNRLVLLRGASIEAMKDDTYLAATVAAPFTPWDEKYFAADNVPGAVRLKHQINEKLLAGSTYTFRTGLIDSSVAEFNQVLGFDGTYFINENTQFVGQIAGSTRDMDLLTQEGIRTSRNGFAYKAEIRSDFDHKHDGHTTWLMGYTQMDYDFQPMNSIYFNTRDDRFWGTHISFDDHPDLEPFKLGDGIDVNRRVLRFNWKEKIFKDRFYNEFDIRNVHRVSNIEYVDTTTNLWEPMDTRLLETVIRDEVTIKLNPRVTAKGLFRVRALPKSMAGIDPIFSGFYFPKDDLELRDLYIANTDVRQGEDPSQFTYSGGLQYAVDARLTLEAIYERTNAIPDFPRGIMNDFYRNPVERIDGVLHDRLQNFMYHQGGGAILAAPPYRFYNIFKQRIIYRPESRLIYTIHATQNEYRAAGSIDDNIAHLGIGVEFNQTKRLNWFMDYTYSALVDVSGYSVSNKDEASYDGHHNFYASFDYRLNAATVLRGEYGVFGLGSTGIVGNPYNVGIFSLPTIDTEHLLRVSLTGDF